MSNHGLNNPGGCFYHHCATVSVGAAGGDGGAPTDASTSPDATTAPDASTGPDATTSPPKRGDDERLGRRRDGRGGRRLDDAARPRRLRLPHDGSRARG